MGSALLVALPPASAEPVSPVAAAPEPAASATQAAAAPGGPALSPTGAAPSPTGPAPSQTGQIPGQPGPVPAPPTARPLTSPTPEQSPPLELELQADQPGFDLLIGRFVATGQVKALLNGGRLLADRLEFDPSSRSVYASGSVRFQRGHEYLQASRLRFNLIQSEGELEDVYGVIDLETADSDFDLARQPSGALLPLSDWDNPDPLLSRQATFGVADASPAPGARVLQALDLQPLAPGGPNANAGIESYRSVAATIRPLAISDWIMPPVALAPPAQSMACPPLLPPIPNWHPYPMAVTLWGGKSIDSNFGDTFKFQGRLRPEYELGLGFNKRLIDAGPVALEWDSNLLGHRALEQAGGEFNQSVKYANSPSQAFGELTTGLGLRLWVQPWLSLAFVEGVSWLSTTSNYEKTFRQNYTQFLNYLGFEIEALVAPQWSLVGRVHHRSGAYGTYSGVSEGSNAYLIGLRYRFGTAPPSRQTLVMAPPLGCADPGRANRVRPRPLGEILNSVAMGPPGQGLAPTPAAPLPGPTPPELPPAKAEGLRQQAIAASVDQRITALKYRGSLSAQQRAGVTGTFTTPDEANTYGGARPAQIQSIRTTSNRQLVSGTVSRWRFQAATLSLTPEGWRGDRVAFSNDPFTPAQSWVDAENVEARLRTNGDTVIQAKRNRLILEDRLPIPLQHNLVFKKKKEVDNRWVLSSDGTDRDGFYIGHNLKPIKLGARALLDLQPQFMVQRALNGSTNSYVLPGQPAGDAPSSQPAQIGDLFGVVARLHGPLLGFDTDVTLNASTLDPTNFANGARSWGELRRPIALPLLGEVTSRLYGAYRYRIWNGSLGEQDIYSAIGVSLEQNKALPNLGAIQNSYYARIGYGTFQGNLYQSTTTGSFSRSSLFASLNSSLPIWSGHPLDLSLASTYPYSPVPVVPGLSLNTNLSLSLFNYSDGNTQNAYTISGGPTLTLGHFSKPFLDYTQITITGGGSRRTGQSPLSFDQLVDLGTIGVGLTQQIVGPLVFNGGIGMNIDPNSPYYGNVTGSYVELRWQRRSYELGIYYSPYEQLGGIRVKLHDFNFDGTGVPFVPYQPSTAQSARSRPF